jgi:benzil reductase ((S)-benzoin forming)
MNLVVVTGVSRGLGRALHDVMLQAQLDNFQYLFLSRSRLAFAAPNTCADYQLWDARTPVELCLDFMREDIGKIFLVSNAGTIDPICASLDLSREELLDALHVNLIGPLKLVAQLVEYAASRNVDLEVLNISSGAASRAIGGWLAYCSSKAAIKMALDVVALEYSHTSVTHVDPGVMDTDMQSTIRSSRQHDMPDVNIFRDMKVAGRLQTAGEVATSIFATIKGNAV